MIYLWELWIPSSERSGSSALQDEHGARQNLWIVCVAHLRLGGLRGKKSTPSIGWEVPMKSRQSASGSCTECMGHKSERTIRQRYTLHFCMVECIRPYAWIYIFSGEVN
jgi:hypothetical protein